MRSLTNLEITRESATKFRMYQRAYGSVGVGFVFRTWPHLDHGFITGVIDAETFTRGIKHPFDLIGKEE